MKNFNLVLVNNQGVQVIKTKTFKSIIEAKKYALNFFSKKLYNYHLIKTFDSTELIIENK